MTGRQVQRIQVRAVFALLSSLGRQPGSTSAVRRTVELVGEGNPLERGLIEAVITGRSPSDAGARAPCPSR
jgi:hypothetical protein